MGKELFVFPHGMTLREWYVGQALPVCLRQVFRESRDGMELGIVMLDEDCIRKATRLAWLAADDMLKARAEAPVWVGEKLKACRQEAEAREEVSDEES